MTFRRTRLFIQNLRHLADDLKELLIALGTLVLLTLTIYHQVVNRIG